jgi:hypothetical protein
MSSFLFAANIKKLFTLWCLYLLTYIGNFLYSEFLGDKVEVQKIISKLRLLIFSTDAYSEFYIVVHHSVPGSLLYTAPSQMLPILTKARTLNVYTVHC